MQGWARSYMVEHAITPASRPVDVRRIYFTNFSSPAPRGGPSHA